MTNLLHDSEIARANYIAIRKDLAETIRQCRISKQYLQAQITESKQFIEEAQIFTENARNFNSLRI